MNKFINTLIILFFIPSLCWFSKTTSASITSIAIPPARSNYDISHDYHVKLLSLALQHSSPETTYEFTNSLAMSQGRAEVELLKGNNIDVYWFGTNKSLERDLRAIKIPTTRGLIGYRKLIIHRKNKKRFDSVRQLSDLSRFVACQGAHWPDTKILRKAGLPVTTSTSYENLFQMINLERCDYFPRGYHDAANELKIRKNKYPSLISYERILLHYPFAVYFFTNKTQEGLAQQIEEGLKVMAEKQEIIDLMKRHPLTESIFPLKSEANSLYFRLENPLMNETNITDSKYWIQPKDFQINTSEE